jgi:transcriptional regulator with XRE-family HTH domain
MVERKNRSKNTNVTHFSRWLKAIMKQHKISNLMLSHKTGIGSNTIVNWRNGLCIPKADGFVMLATGLATLLKVSRPEIMEKMAEQILKDC